MADVVDQLKLTPKGQLQYGRFTNEGKLISSLSKLSISPSTVKNFPKITEEEINASATLEKNPVSYLVRSYFYIYFSLQSWDFWKTW